MAKLIEDDHGTKFISRLDSWVMWNKITKGFEPMKRITGKRGVISSYEWLDAGGWSECPTCEGTREVNYKVDDRTESIRCVCSTLDYQLEISNILNPYRSPIGNYSLDTLKPVDESMTRAITAARKFVDYPSNWLTILGDTGCGKTHILKSIARYYFPIAIYISADDLAGHLFASLDDHATSEMTNALNIAPILLLDDWGTEHKTDFISGNIRSIINHRYNAWDRLPTVVASNMDSSNLLERDQRIGSRLLDPAVSELVRIISDDYRVKAGVGNGNNQL